MEVVNGGSSLGDDKGGPPPPSPLTGCYLLIVVGEPHLQEHKEIILQRIAKGLLSWDVNDCLVNLEKELAIITDQGLEGEEARYGERLIQFASENLVTEILIHPSVSTLSQCIRNLLSSFTKHRHIIHAGYAFQGNGSWALQDGTFSYSDFCEAFQEIEVQRVIHAYENSISLHLHCSVEGEWGKLPKENFAKMCKVRINPTDVLTIGSPPISNFIKYLDPFLIPSTLESILESSDVVGNIRFSRPTLYVFPGGQGDAALFGINGFNMLLDGGFSRKACFWDFVRHLDRLDAVLISRLNNSNVSGISSVLRRKRQGAIYPQIGHFFCNIPERKSLLSPDGDKDKDPLILSLIEDGQKIVQDLRYLHLAPQPCYRDNEPIILYHKVGHGTLNMYVLSPDRNSREVREFIYKWNQGDTKLFAGSRGGKDFVFPLQNVVSICVLLVWQPSNPNDTITRILYPGSASQKKIIEGLDRLRTLEFIKHPICSEKSLAPVKKTKQDVIEKLVAKEKPLSEKKIENKMLIEDGLKNGDVNGDAKGKHVMKSDSTDSEKEKKSKKEDEIKIEDVAKIEDKTKSKTKSAEIKPAKPKVELQPKKKSVPEKKAPPTPKKTVENKPNGELKEKERKQVLKPSPTATPAKSTKDANNRKVVESKRQPIKKDAAAKHVPPPSDGKAKQERKPISRRPKTAKAPLSPAKKITNGVQKPDSISKRGKLDKEGTTDSSTVSTPSADQDSLLKKDISKLTPEEIQQLKERELEELKEEQEAVKEIEAVFRKDEQRPEAIEAGVRKIKDVSLDDKVEPEEYLIIEKEEVEHDSLDQEIKEDEMLKLARDSEESEKRRKLSSEEKDACIQLKEIKELATVKQMEPTVSLSDDKGTPATDRKENLEDEVKEVGESHPEEKISATVESGATTTAPTLPEDDGITLDEIKEDNGQVIEEKHVKEETKEKEVPVIQLPPKIQQEAQYKIQPGVGIPLDKQKHIKDIVKTPDEVADLPVHEEVDYHVFHADNKKIHEAETLIKPLQESKDHPIKADDKDVKAEKVQDIEQPMVFGAEEKLSELDKLTQAKIETEVKIEQPTKTTEELKQLKEDKEKIDEKITAASHADVKTEDLKQLEDSLRKQSITAAKSEIPTSTDKPIETVLKTDEKTKVSMTEKTEETKDKEITAVDEFMLKEKLKETTDDEWIVITKEINDADEQKDNLEEALKDIEIEKAITDYELNKTEKLEAALEDQIVSEYIARDLKENKETSIFLEKKMKNKEDAKGFESKLGNKEQVDDKVQVDEIVVSKEKDLKDLKQEKNIHSYTVDTQLEEKDLKQKDIVQKDLKDGNKDFKEAADKSNKLLEKDQEIAVPIEKTVEKKHEDSKAVILEKTSFESDEKDSKIIVVDDDVKAEQAVIKPPSKEPDSKTEEKDQTFSGQVVDDLKEKEPQTDTSKKVLEISSTPGAKPSEVEEGKDATLEVIKTDKDVIPKIQADSKDAKKIENEIATEEVVDANMEQKSVKTGEKPVSDEKQSTKEITDKEIKNLRGDKTDSHLVDTDIEDKKDIMKLDSKRDEQTSGEISQEVAVAIPKEKDLILDQKHTAMKEEISESVKSEKIVDSIELDLERGGVAEEAPIATKIDLEEEADKSFEFLEKTNAKIDHPILKDETDLKMSDKPLQEDKAKGDVNVELAKISITKGSEQEKITAARSVQKLSEKEEDAKEVTQETTILKQYEKDSEKITESVDDKMETKGAKIDITFTPKAQDIEEHKTLNIEEKDHKFASSTTDDAKGKLTSADTSVKEFEAPTIDSNLTKEKESETVTAMEAIKIGEHVIDKIKDDLKDSTKSLETSEKPLLTDKEVAKDEIDEKITNLKVEKIEVAEIDDKLQELKKSVHESVDEIQVSKLKSAASEADMKHHDLKHEFEQIAEIETKLQDLKSASSENLANQQEFEIGQVKAEPAHAEEVVLYDSSPEEDITKERLFKELDIDKENLGRKSPAEREEDVKKIVANVAEVLKSEAPLEEIAGKLPFTQKLRETHITSQELPFDSKIESKVVITEEIPPIPEESILPEEETKPEARKDLLAGAQELMAESSKMISGIKHKISDDKEQEKVDEKDEDTGIVHRMLVTASSEDGGEETEICPAGTINFSRSSESSGKSSPELTQNSQMQESLLKISADAAQEITSSRDIEKGTEEAEKEIKGKLDDKDQEIPSITETKKSDPQTDLKEDSETIDSQMKQDDAYIPNKFNDTIKSDLIGTSEEIVSKSEEIIQKIEEAALSKIEQLESKTESVKESVKDVLKSSEEDLIKKAGDLASKSVEEIKKSEDSATTKIGQLEETIEEAKEQLEDKAKHVGSDLFKTLNNLKNDVVEAVGSTIKKAEGTVEKIEETISAKIDDALVKEQDFQSKSQELLPKATELVHEKTEDLSLIGKHIERKIDEVKDNLTDEFKLIDGAVEQKFKKVEDAVTTKIEDIKQQVEATIKKTADDISEKKEDLDQKPDDVIIKSADVSKETGKQITEELSKTLDTKHEKVEAIKNDLIKKSEETIDKTVKIDTPIQTSITAKTEDILIHKIGNGIISSGHAIFEQTETVLEQSESDLTAKGTGIEHKIEKDLSEIKSHFESTVVDVISDAKSEMAGYGAEVESDKNLGKDDTKLKDESKMPEETKPEKHLKDMEIAKDVKSTDIIAAGREVIDSKQPMPKTPDDFTRKDSLIKEERQLTSETHDKKLPDPKGQIETENINKDIPKDHLQEKIEQLKKDFESIDKLTDQIEEYKVDKTIIEKEEQQIEQQADQLKQGYKDLTKLVEETSFDKCKTDEFKIDKNIIEKEEKQLEKEADELRKSYEDLTQLAKEISFDKCKQDDEFKIDKEVVEAEEKKLGEQAEYLRRSYEDLTKLAEEVSFDKCKLDECKIDKDVIEKEEKQLEDEAEALKKSYEDLTELAKDISFDKCQKDEFKIGKDVIEKEEKHIDGQVDNLEKNYNKLSELSSQVSFDKCKMTAEYKVDKDVIEREEKEIDEKVLHLQHSLGEINDLAQSITFDKCLPKTKDAHDIDNKNIDSKNMEEKTGISDVKDGLKSDEKTIEETTKPILDSNKIVEKIEISGKIAKDEQEKEKDHDKQDKEDDFEDHAKKDDPQNLKTAIETKKDDTEIANLPEKPLLQSVTTDITKIDDQQEKHERELGEKNLIAETTEFDKSEKKEEKDPIETKLVMDHKTLDHAIKDAKVASESQPLKDKISDSDDKEQKEKKDFCEITKIGDKLDDKTTLHSDNSKELVSSDVLRPLSDEKVTDDISQEKKIPETKKEVQDVKEKDEHMDKKETVISTDKEQDIKTLPDEKSVKDEHPVKSEVTATLDKIAQAQSEKSEQEIMEKIPGDKDPLVVCNDVKKVSISDIEISIKTETCPKNASHMFLESERALTGDSCDAKVFLEPAEPGSGDSRTTSHIISQSSPSQIDSHPQMSSSTLQLSDSDLTSSGKITPPTVPVSPIAAKDLKSPSLKLDSGLSEQTETDDDDLSTKSQVGQSELDELDMKMDPMSMSFYGALPDAESDDVPPTLLYETTKAKYAAGIKMDESEPEELDGDEMNLMTASFIGELPSGSRDIKSVDVLEPSPFNLAPTHLYEITKAKYSLYKESTTESSTDTEIFEMKKGTTSDPMTTSVYFGEDDPIASWGRPLKLPSPAPPNNNNGTPKKERRVPAYVSVKNKLNDDRKRAESPSKFRSKRVNPVYVDLTYVPHHGNHYYAYVDFFKKIRARYYVFSGLEPSRQVYDALLEAKQTWEDKELEVTIIPTYDTDILGYWIAENEDLLTKFKIDLSPSASRCTINLQDHETSCSAYRLEF